MELSKLHLFVFYCLIFLVYVFTLIYDSFYLEHSFARQSYAGRLKFLTFWNELIQTAYFGFAVINTIFGSNVNVKQRQQNPEQYTRMQRFKDFIAATIVFPVGMFVVLTFWSLYAIDRELVFPAVMDKYVPAWINHIWHTSVIVFVTAEKLIIYQQYPSTRRGLLTVFMFGIVYVLWLFWVAYFGDIWVYPIFRVLTWPLRILFILICALLLSFCYFTGAIITRVVWPSPGGSLKID